MLNLFQLFMGFIVCADRDKWLNSGQIRNSNNFKMKGVNLTDVGADAALSAEGCFPAVVLMQYSSHTLSWQLAIVFVAFGMAGVNKTLLENMNLSCSSQISFFWSVFFCHFWGNNKAAHRENAGQRCSFLIHSHKIISRNIINMFHSSDLCVSLLFLQWLLSVFLNHKNLKTLHFLLKFRASSCCNSSSSASSSSNRSSSSNNSSSIF